jgi:hypothetical protein
MTFESPHSRLNHLKESITPSATLFTPFTFESPKQKYQTINNREPPKNTENQSSQLASTRALHSTRSVAKNPRKGQPNTQLAV